MVHPTNPKTVRRMVPILLAAALAASPALAEKPEWAGGGKHEQGGKAQRQDKAHKHEGKHEGKHEDKHEGKGGRREPAGQRAAPAATVTLGGYFHEPQRVVLRDYYGTEFKRGHCPPGLAKKHNGCLPPGQAKKWTVGRPLPAGVIQYAVPSALVVQLGMPPAGHKYVRVAADILLIAVGTGMVVDGISGLLGP